ncbi:MAG TPA: N-acetylmuramoyl-L-alanine amidase [Chloroflexota bacterium]|jgi:N-acetylmuramoyl-L-alanine amidase
MRLGDGTVGRRLARHAGARTALWLLALVCLVPTWPARPAEAAPLDWVVSAGHFYSQTAAEGFGFVVSDADGIPFQTELQRRGGPTALGYPISHRFEWKGTTVQAFQKVVLQWLPSENRVAFVNVFDDLSKAGRDDWLKTVRSTPGQAWLDDEQKLPWDAVVKGRLAFLDANPAIKARYMSVRDPMTMFGLPASRVEDMGNHYAVRLQRAVIQLWKVDVPWARAGQTTVANGGDIAKEAGLFPGNPLNPATPDGSPRAGGSSGPGSAPSTASTSPAVSFRDPPIRDVPRAGAARKVVLDPGHGGAQIGAAGQPPGAGPLREKDLNLDVVRRTAQLLRAAGYDVVQTRDGDQQVGGPKLTDDLQRRVDIANQFKADAFVSIHHNGMSNRTTRGLEVYYAADRPFSGESRALAELVYQQLGRHMAAAGYEPFARGVRTDTSIDGDHLYLLSPATERIKQPSTMPAALGEALFLTNDADLAALGRPEIRDAIARGYAVAIGTFLAGRKPWSPA